MKVPYLIAVREFFRQRAGLFFVLLGVLFGFLSGREHQAFALFFLSAAYGMWYLLAIWLVYTWLCAQFILRLWSQPEYQFVYYLRLLSMATRFRRALLMGLGLLQPLIYYGVYLATVGWSFGYEGRLGWVILYIGVLAVALAMVAEWRLLHPHLFLTASSKPFHLPFKRPASWIFWSLEWLLRERTLTFLIGKIGASVVVLCTLLYAGTGDYDIRLPAIGLSIGYLLNIGLSYELYVWESDIWIWGRSLPVSRSKRLVDLIIIHILISIPETLLALRQAQLTIPELVQLCLLGVSLLLLFHVYLYKRNTGMEELVKPIFAGFVVLTLLILYKVPVLVLAAVTLGLTAVKFGSWYCIFQKHA